MFMVTNIVFKERKMTKKENHNNINYSNTVPQNCL